MIFESNMARSVAFISLSCFVLLIHRCEYSGCAFAKTVARKIVAPPPELSFVTMYSSFVPGLSAMLVDSRLWPDSRPGSSTWPMGIPLRLRMTVQTSVVCMPGTTGLEPATFALTAKRKVVT
jgi:hypothetical protein